MTGCYLIADIGATNARFALADDLAAWPGDDALLRATLATNAYASAQSLLAAAREELGFAALDGACLAVAGPVHDGCGSMTNSELVIDAERVAEELGCPVTVVNDFVAMAQGVPCAHETLQIGGDAAAEGVIAVVGPGSGFGVSALIPWDSGYRVLASESGHCDLAPGSPLEQELLVLLSQQHTVVSWETVLSGPGLVNLYRAMAALWGAEPEPATPQWVSEQGRRSGDPICHQTLETFFGFLGAAAGNLALTFRASGGVYIGGGIVPQLAEFATTSPLRRRFEERGPLTDYVAGIPIWLLMDPDPGLVGALECLRVTQGAGASKM